MKPLAVIRTLRHPFGALATAAIFAVTAGVALHAALEAWNRAVTTDDPAAISDSALAGIFDQAVAEREITTALASGDIDLAQSVVDLAADRGVAVDPALADEVRKAATRRPSFTDTTTRFAHGLWSGEPTDVASFAGTAAGDLFVFGDVRDAAREGTRYLAGEHYDAWLLGLAGAGLVITAGTYATLGAGLPERIGVTLLKAARRTGRIHPALATRFAREVVTAKDAGALIDVAGNVGRMEAKAGAQATLDGLALAEQPADMSRLARLAAAKGGRTRAILKLLGRGAIVATAGAFDLALWLAWAVAAFIGFCSSCKAAAERVTIRILRRRRRNRAVHAQA